MPLTKRRKERFVNALRSGDYTQAFGQMFIRVFDWEPPFDRDNFGKPTGEVLHCAIGVLVADEMGKEYNPYTDEGHTKWIKRFGKKRKFPHHHVSQYDFYNTFGMHQGEADKIMELNDRRKMSFNEIADWVEENIKTKK